MSPIMNNDDDFMTSYGSNVAVRLEMIIFALCLTVRRQMVGLNLQALKLTTKTEMLQGVC